MTSFAFFYSIQFLIYILSELTSNKNSRLVLIWTSLIIVILFTGLRYKVGNDYSVYFDFFSNPDSINDGIEFGFRGLIHFLSGVGVGPYGNFFVIATLTHAIFYYFFFKSNSLFPIIIYLLTPGLFLNSMHLVRQPLAIAVFCLGTLFLSSRRGRILGVALLMISVAIHFSAFLALIVCIALNSYGKIINKKIAFILIFVAFIFQIYIFDGWLI